MAIIQHQEYWIFSNKYSVKGITLIKRLHIYQDRETLATKQKQQRSQFTC